MSNQFADYIKAYRYALSAAKQTGKTLVIRRLKAGGYNVALLGAAGSFGLGEIVGPKSKEKR